MNKKIVRRGIIAGVSTLLMVYLSSLAYIYYGQEEMLFHPTKLEEGFQFSFAHGLAFEEVSLPTPDGHTLHALHFRTAADSAKGVVFYLHGNAGYLEHEGNVAPYFAGCGYDVFMLDYRGYGKSTGQIVSEAQLHADVALAYDRLLKTYSESQIVVYGWSIGTGMAVRLAADRAPKLLLLEAPYLSMESLAKQNMPPIVPVAWLLRYPLRSDEYIPKVECPVYIFHGTADPVIPYAQGKALQERAGDNATIVTLEGAGHDVKSAYKKFGETLCAQILGKHE